MGDQLDLPTTADKLNAYHKLRANEQSEEVDSGVSVTLEKIGVS
jgi:hypothetical protein